MSDDDDVVELHQIPLDTGMSLQDSAESVAPNEETTALQAPAARNEDAAIFQDAPPQESEVTAGSQVASPEEVPTPVPKKRGRKETTSTSVDNNSSGNDLGDSIGERRKIKRRACVVSKDQKAVQKAAVNSTRRNYQKKKTQAGNMENTEDNHETTRNEENKDNDNILDQQGNSTTDKERDEDANGQKSDEEEQHLDEHESEENSKEEDCEKEDDEEESEEEDDDDDDLAELDQDDDDVINQGDEVIDVDKGELVPFDPNDFSAKNTIKQDEIITSQEWLLQVEFLPLSFFIHSTSSLLVCTYSSFVLNISVYLNFPKKTTEYNLYVIFSISELPKLTIPIQTIHYYQVSPKSIIEVCLCRMSEID